MRVRAAHALSAPPWHGLCRGAAVPCCAVPPPWTGLLDPRLRPNSARGDPVRGLWSSPSGLRSGRCVGWGAVGWGGVELAPRPCLPRASAHPVCCTCSAPVQDIKVSMYNCDFKALRVLGVAAGDSANEAVIDMEVRHAVLRC